jgi:NAD(P)-dependent dehydrogenase (short-subunit alcohol dehydrogenase family)
MRGLEGRVAIVTGSGRGIGRAEAITFSEHGAAVVVNDVDKDNAAAVVDEIVSAGGRAVPFIGDASNWDEAERMVQTAIDEFGQLDILMNNAGFLRDAMSWDMTEANWDAVIKVHLGGHFAPSRFALAYWREQARNGTPRDARIIMTSSEAALYGNAEESNYGAAKGAIAALTVILARELEEFGVTVNAICPRARTPATVPMFGSIMDVAEGEFDRFDPFNLTPFVTWLAGPDSAHVSGQIFVVFGGEIRLMQRWEPASRIVKRGQWTVDELTERTSELFAEHDPGVPPFGVKVKSS